MLLTTNNLIPYEQCIVGQNREFIIDFLATETIYTLMVSTHEHTIRHTTLPTV